MKDLLDQLGEGGKSIHELENAKRNLVSERNELQAALEEAELAVENEKSKMLRIQFEMSQSKQDNIRNFYCKILIDELIDDMLETAVYDDKIFDVKKEDGGIRIKKLNDEWRVVSFPKSQKITSFTVINKSGSPYLCPYFSNTPYTKKTGL